MKMKHQIITVISRGDQADIGIIKEILTDYVTNRYFDRIKHGDQESMYIKKIEMV